jgi:hypothetical protein
LSGTTRCSHNAKPVRSAAVAPSTPSLAELPSHQAVTIARVHHRSDPAAPRDTLAEPTSFIFFFFHVLYFFVKLPSRSKTPILYIFCKLSIHNFFS